MRKTETPNHLDARAASFVEAAEATRADEPLIWPFPVNERIARARESALK